MSSLKATSREIGGVTIVDLNGPIALGESSALFGKTIRELTHNDRTKIILNLRDVSAIDSAGIGELVRAYILVKSRGGEMRLLNPTKKVSDRLDLTRLLRVIEVFTDEALDLRSFDLNIRIFEDAQIAISLYRVVGLRTNLDIGVRRWKPGLIVPLGASRT